MRFFYLDASAWVKRYFAEAGSERLDSLFDEGTLVSSSLGYLETAAALSRQRRSRKLDEQELSTLESKLDRVWGKLMQLDVTNATIHSAVDIARSYQLRGADAIHLAAALSFSGSLFPGNLVFVTADRELVKAGTAAGLQIHDLSILE